MIFTSYASGSTGNLYSVSDGQTNILIECGIPYRQMQRLLPAAPTSYDACLISHRHMDHCKAEQELIHRGINVYRGLDIEGVELRVGTIDVKAFHVKHMDVQSGENIPNFGFLLRSRIDGDYLVFATDTYYLRPIFPAAAIWAVECNFATDLVEPDCPYADRLYKSHMELGTLLETFRKNDMSKCREIHLLHLSGSHADAKRFKKAVQQTTGKATYIAGEKR
jgi:phosphoribosyl 1,2-cyclic phosphodiesterase